MHKIIECGVMVVKYTHLHMVKIEIKNKLIILT